MKNKPLKIIVFAFIMLCSFITFAQGPGDGADDGDLEDTDPPASIDQNLLLLSVSGISVAFLCFSQKAKAKI